MSQSFRLMIEASRRADWREIRGLGDAEMADLLVADITPSSPEEHQKLVVKAREDMGAGYTTALIPRRPVKAIFFDMDATVIAEESIVELSRAAGREEEVQAITEKAMRGEIDFSIALKRRVAVLQGLSESVLQSVASRLTLNPGITEFAAKAASHGILLFLVSGGFRRLAEGIAQELGFHSFEANTLEVQGGYLTGMVAGSIVDGEAKRAFVEQTMAHHALARDEIVVVGDGANDLPMMGASGIAIGFRPKPLLVPHLDGANFSGDHRVLIDLLL